MSLFVLQYCFITMFLLVTGVLVHVGVATDFAIRDRIDSEVWVNTTSIFSTTLEAPQILAACVEAEAVQVATTASFHIELFAPLVDQCLCIYRL